MNTKKRIFSILLLTLSLLGLAIMSFMLTWAITDCVDILTSDNTTDDDMTPTTALISTILGSAMWFLSLLMVNWGGCLIWVEDGILYRRGLLFGLKRSCAVGEVLRVRVVPTPRKSPDLIYIIKKDPGKFHQNISKKSYICLEDTPGNRAFIESFCGKKIKRKKIV